MHAKFFPYSDQNIYYDITIFHKWSTVFITILNAGALVPLSKMVWVRMLMTSVVTREE